MRNAKRPSSKPLYSETLEKGLQILTLFSEAQQSLTLTEISRRLKINKTTIYRFINTYCKLGYLRRDIQTKQFKLGPLTPAFAHTFLLGSDLVELFKPVVDRAYLRLRVSIDVTLLHGDSVYVVYRRENEDTINFRRAAGGAALYLLSTGKAALAYLPPREQAAMISRLVFEPNTTHTIRSRPELEAELRRTRTRGYAIGNEEYLPGLLALGAPLINRHLDRVQGAMSFMTSTQHYSMAEFEAAYANPLVELAKEISALLPVS